MKKIIALVLVMCLALTLFTACSNKGPSLKDIQKAGKLVVIADDENRENRERISNMRINGENNRVCTQKFTSPVARKRKPSQFALKNNGRKSLAMCHI